MTGNSHSQTEIVGEDAAASVKLLPQAQDGAFSCTSGICSLTGGIVLGGIKLYYYDSFNISAGATVNITGNYKTVINVYGDVTIDGALKANANGITGVAGGANGGNGVCSGTAGAGVSGKGDGTPGTGGGLGGQSGGYLPLLGAGGGGGYGGSGFPSYGGTPGGSSYGTNDISILYGGSGGGGGGAMTNDELCGGSGGGGGGVIELYSETGFITIASAGSIEANGADGTEGDNYWDGGGEYSGGGGGGGSGGSIILRADAVSNNGTIQAKGGTGGRYYKDNIEPQYVYAGAGAGGRVYIEKNNGSIGTVEVDNGTSATGSFSKIATRHYNLDYPLVQTNNTAITAAPYVQGGWDNRGVSPFGGVSGMSNVKRNQKTGDASSVRLTSTGAPRTAVYVDQKRLANLGGRTSADSKCAASWRVPMDAYNIKAFLTVSASDRLLDMSSIYGASNPVYWYKSAENKYTQFANNWADMLDGTISVGANGVNTDYNTADPGWWWSGSDRDGNYLASSGSCSGWTSVSPLITGAFGGYVTSNFTWIENGGTSCSNSQYLMCAANVDAEYSTPGTYTSYMDAGEAVSYLWNSFNWNQTVSDVTICNPTCSNNLGGSISVKVKTSNSSAASPDFGSGTCDGSSSGSAGSAVISDSCRNSADRYIWYQFTLNAGQNNTNTPFLDQVIADVSVDIDQLQFQQYHSSGTYTSGAIDAGAGVVSWDWLSWTKTGTGTITMKARTDADGNFSDAPDWASCTGMDDSNGFIPSSGGCVTNTDRFIQYQATLSTADAAVTPSLDEVTISYTSWPRDTGLEKRIFGSPSALNSQEYAASPNAWYTGFLRRPNSNDLQFILKDSAGAEIYNISAPPPESSFNSFSNFFVHGDKDFLVDDVLIRRYLKDENTELLVAVGAESPALPAVKVNGIAATNVAYDPANPDTVLTAIAPANSVGIYDVEVINPDGSSGICAACLEYAAKPSGLKVVDSFRDFDSAKYMEYAGAEIDQYNAVPRTVEGNDLNTDPSFCTVRELVSGNGVIISNPSSMADVPYSIVANNTGIYAIGYDDSQVYARWRIEKRNRTTGALIPEFGPGGVDGDGVVTNYDISGLYAGAGAAASDATGLYVVGHDTPPPYSRWRIEKRDLTTGTLIPEFGPNGGDGDGVVTSVFAEGAGAPSAIAIDSTGIYVVGYGYASVGWQEWRIEKRDLITGDLIPEFGPGEPDGNGVITRNFSQWMDIITDIAIDSSGIYVTGVESILGRFNQRYRIEKRDLTTGALIPEFGPGEPDGNGAITFDASSGNSFGKISVDITGIYIGGASNVTNNWRVQKRDLTTGALIPEFGPGDTDGDGVITSGSTSRGLEDMYITSTNIYIVGGDVALGVSNSQWRIEKRDLTTGALIPEFGPGDTDGDGVITRNPSDFSDAPYAVFVDSSSMYIAGYDMTSSDVKWRIEKRDAVTGDLDSDFGTYGADCLSSPQESASFKVPRRADGETLSLRVYGNRGTDDNGIYADMDDTITYVALPEITDIDPPRYLAEVGGSSVVVSGNYFKTNTSQTIAEVGGIAATIISPPAPTSASFTFSAPAHASGKAALRVYGDYGTLDNQINNQNYNICYGNRAPTVTITGWGALFVGKPRTLTGKGVDPEENDCGEFGVGSMTYRWTIDLSPQDPSGYVLETGSAASWVGFTLDFTPSAPGAYRIKLEMIDIDGAGATGVAYAPSNSQVTHTLRQWKEVRPP